MHTAGSGRLEKITAYRAVDEGPEQGSVDAAGVDSPTRRLDADRTGPRTGREKSPLADPCHELQPALRKPQTFVQRRQPPLQLRRGHYFVRERVTERFQADAAKVHRELGVRQRVSELRQPRTYRDAGGR